MSPNNPGVQKELHEALERERGEQLERKRYVRREEGPPAGYRNG